MAQRDGIIQSLLNRQNKKHGLIRGVGTILLVVIILLVSAFTMFNPVVRIHAGERGVVTNFGAVQNRVLGEGINFIVPIAQSVVRMDVRVQELQTEVASVSRDGQEILTTAALNYRLDPDRVDWVYQQLGQEYESRIIAPSVQEMVKEITGKYSVEEIITYRSELREEIREALKQDLQKYQIILVDFGVLDFSFPRG